MSRRKVTRRSSTPAPRVCPGPIRSAATPHRVCTAGKGPDQWPLDETEPRPGRAFALHVMPNCPTSRSRTARISPLLPFLLAQQAPDRVREAVARLRTHRCSIQGGGNLPSRTGSKPGVREPAADGRRSRLRPAGGQMDRQFTVPESPPQARPGYLLRQARADHAGVTDGPGEQSGALGPAQNAAVPWTLSGSRGRGVAGPAFGGVRARRPERGRHPCHSAQARRPRRARPPQLCRCAPAAGALRPLRATRLSWTRRTAGGAAVTGRAWPTAHDAPPRSGRLRGAVSQTVEEEGSDLPGLDQPALGGAHGADAAQCP